MGEREDVNPMLEMEMWMVPLAAKGIDGRLVYCLLTDAVVEEDVFAAVYGVAVALETAQKTVMRKIHNVTTDRERMRALIRQMAEGRVFPATLPDIIEDFIA
jgi:hypothetical protein